MVGAVGIEITVILKIDRVCAAMPDFRISPIITEYYGTTTSLAASMSNSNEPLSLRLSRIPASAAFSKSAAAYDVE
jgi:hypothetical protein